MAAPWILWEISIDDFKHQYQYQNRFPQKKTKHQYVYFTPEIDVR